ncbi:MAG: M48 family metallopeptidase [Candidatus Altiarchaeota archaeon]|nr:M48 family metallopeptidase [Candidatus Altiarchaeota archaeon]
MRTMFEQVRANKSRSYLLMGFFIVMIGVLGAVIGLLWENTYLGVGFAVIISIVYTIFTYYAGDQLILSMTGAREATKKEFPFLVNTVEGLALAAGIPAPKPYVIDDSALNAYATGRDPNHASITVTTGLLKAMDRQELEGVVAHEMSHIQNYDIRLMMLAAVLVGLVTLLSDFIFRSVWYGGRGRDRDRGGGQIQIVLFLLAILFAFLAPIIGQLIKLAVSRQREYLADASAVVLTRYPAGLAGALEKIAKDPDPLVDNANKATAHLFISTPFRKDAGIIAPFFSTHPPIEDRIKRLKGM